MKPLPWILFQSRRGMKELDLAFQTINHRFLKNFSSQELEVYCQLLQEEDHTLFFWLFQNHLSSPPHYQALLASIKQVLNQLTVDSP